MSESIEEVKKFVCPECGFSSDSSRGLAGHMRLKHMYPSKQDGYKAYVDDVVLRLETVWNERLKSQNDLFESLRDLTVAQAKNLEQIGAYVEAQGKHVEIVREAQPEHGLSISKREEAFDEAQDKHMEVFREAQAKPSIALGEVHSVVLEEVKWASGDNWFDCAMACKHIVKKCAWDCLNKNDFELIFGNMKVQVARKEDSSEDVECYLKEISNIFNVDVGKIREVYGRIQVTKKGDGWSADYID